MGLKDLLLPFCIVIGMICSSTLADSGETTLRVTSPPVGTFTTTLGTTRITAVQVQVKNVGSNDAQSVQVYALLPNGERRALVGPSALARNKSAKYSSHFVSSEVASSKKIEAEVSCANCR